MTVLRHCENVSRVDELAAAHRHSYHDTSRGRRTQWRWVVEGDV